MCDFLILDVGVSRFHTDQSTGEEPRVIRIAWWRSDQPEPECRIIRPKPEMTVSPQTVPYHGLTLTDLVRHGVDPESALKEFSAAAKDAKKLVSYNSDFHWRNLLRLMGAADGVHPDNAVCVMKLATPICNIPGFRRGVLKNPSLREACAHFNVEPPLTLSSHATPVQMALSTVRAVRAVYEACLKEQSR